MGEKITRNKLMKLIIRYAKDYAHAGELAGLLTRTDTANKLESAIDELFTENERLRVLVKPAKHE